jgi:molybdenum cofactor cytidylyltransferase
LNVVAILLAAGSAKRFGSDKLLHALPHEVPIAIQAARHLRAVFEKGVFAVIRPDARALAGLLRKEGCEVVECENAAEGMGASLACAVRAANAAGPADAYLVALGDMPFIRASTIAAVRDALAAGAPLVAPYFHARRGHPVGLAAQFRSELEALERDEGARKIIAAHEKSLLKIPVGDPGVIRDIDTPGDLAPPIVV